MSEKKLWTVTELTRSIRDLLEDAFFPFWMTAEVGNLTIHSSGHVYLTLKDSRTQIPAVFFSGSSTARRLKLVEGMEVEVYGNLSVYEARGQYQFNVQKMRVKGLGSLQQQFDAMKMRLLKEGLFDQENKQELPLLPKCIGLVTSMEGAALQDFLQIINRRFADVHLKIYPSAVQGEGADLTIASGVELLDEDEDVEVIIVMRGGGSLEDLWAFNSEHLARTIADSETPVVSAVGHEVDFTIADFVADLRVPTPSAAAELVIGQKAGYQETISNLQRRLGSSLELKLSRLTQRLDRLAGSYVLQDPRKILQAHQQRCDDLQLRLSHGLDTLLPQQQQKCDDLQSRLNHSLDKVLPKYQQKCDDLQSRLSHSLEKKMDHAHYALESLQSQLKLLNPKGVLERGYAIVSDEQGKVLMNPKDADEGVDLTVLLADGEMTVRKQ